jgi:hypothetical protein
MVHKKTNANRSTDIPNSYDVPIPKPPAELLEAFLMSLQSKLVTRRHPNSRTTHKQHARNRLDLRPGLQQR